MASDLCIERKDSKWEIRDSPAKKQRCEDYGSPPPLCSSAEEGKEKEKEKEDPRSKIVVYNYDDSDVEDDSDGMHEFTEREYQEHHRQMTESDGFDVMSFPRSFACGTTTPLSNFNEIADDLKAFSELALKEYNEKEHTNLEFVKVVKVNKAVVAGFLYYITFDVRDAAAVDGGTTEFQACVWDGIAHTEVLISRLKTST
ncbi:Cysteine proteinase inhibitor 1 [Camellia lanceoleosa]|uniref:Cysteine proteinase inhibitor 1 n=1 Tax=Camellia lanceoleosa TaxID=1840588 RepID=A0ACC0G2H1_9ERIC|nr:Cysteine proteinase inhibitor 1 [Camellia lanceoleosa]